MGNSVNLQKALDHGKTLLEGRYYADAIEHFSTAIDHLDLDTHPERFDDPLLAELYFHRAMALISDTEQDVFNDRDVFHQALEDIDSALDLQPENGIYLLSRGHLYASANFTSYGTEAAEDFLTVLYHDPSHTDALRMLGQLYTREAKYEEAIVCFDRLIDQKGNEKEAWLFRALCHYRKDPPDYMNAIRDFNQAEKHYPDKPEIRVWRASCFENLGEIGRAINEYDGLVAAYPRNGDFLAQRGSLFLRMDDPARARANFEQALAIGPNALALNNLAWMDLQQGNALQAREKASLALSTDPSLGVAHATLAEAYAALGDRASMFMALKQAVIHYFESVADLLEEPAFEGFHTDPEFQHLVSQFEAIQGQQK